MGILCMSIVFREDWNAAAFVRIVMSRWLPDKEISLNTDLPITVKAGAQH